MKIKHDSWFMRICFFGNENLKIDLKYNANMTDSCTLAKAFFTGILKYMLIALSIVLTGGLVLVLCGTFLYGTFGYLFIDGFTLDEKHGMIAYIFSTSVISVAALAVAIYKIRSVIDRRVSKKSKFSNYGTIIKSYFKKICCRVEVEK